MLAAPERSGVAPAPPMRLTLPYELDGLRLRRLRADDLAPFLDYRSDPVVARFQGWDPMDEVQARAFIARNAAVESLTPGAWCQLAVAEAAGDALIGDLGLWLSSDAACAEFGMSIACGHQGRGHGSETARGAIALLFAAAPVARVQAHADVRNLACLRALERVGMRQVGERRLEWKGEACVEHGFVLSRAEAAALGLIRDGAPAA